MEAGAGEDGKGTNDVDLIDECILDKTLVEEEGEGIGNVDPVGARGSTGSSCQLLGCGGVLHATPSARRLPCQPIEPVLTQKATS